MGLVNLCDLQDDSKSVEVPEKPQRPTQKKKAFKTSHRKDQSTADARERVLQEVDENKEWRVSKIGPIMIMWGKRKVQSAKGKKIHKFYIKPYEKHHIWVQWTQGDWENRISHWSVEPQEFLRKAGLGHIVDKVLNKKVIWPYPNESEGKGSGFEKRLEICKRDKFTAWEHPDDFVKENYSWEFHGGVFWDIWDISSAEDPHINQEVVSGWFLASYVQVDDGNVTECKKEMFEEFIADFGLQVPENERNLKFRLFWAEIQRCLSKNKKSHYPLVKNYHLDKQRLCHLTRRSNSGNDVPREFFVPEVLQTDKTSVEEELMDQS